MSNPHKGTPTLEQMLEMCERIRASAATLRSLAARAQESPGIVETVAISKQLQESPAGSALVEKIDGCITDLSQYDVANHRGRYARLRDQSIDVLARARARLSDLERELAEARARDDKQCELLQAALADNREQHEQIASLESALQSAQADAEKFSRLFHMLYGAVQGVCPDCGRTLHTSVGRAASVPPSPPSGRRLNDVR